MQTDPIADFLTCIRNAAAAKHQRVDVPASRLKSEIARILKEEGYISTFKMVDENKSHKTLRVFLKYTPDRRSVISGIKRISRPGARRYVGSQDVKPADWASASSRRPRV
jgi:small subunit ribosomal protein S8